MDSYLLIMVGILFITNGISLLIIAFISERYKEAKWDVVALHEALNKKKGL